MKKIGATPLPSNLSAFAEKAELDTVATRVAVAIKVYCKEKGIKFSGKPKPIHIDGKVDYIIKSEAAKLLVEVFESLSIRWKDKQIGTYMTKANQAIIDLAI